MIRKLCTLFVTNKLFVHSRLLLRFLDYIKQSLMIYKLSNSSKKFIRYHACTSFMKEGKKVRLRLSKYVFLKIVSSILTNLNFVGLFLIFKMLSNTLL